MKRVLFLLSFIFMGIGMATAQTATVTGKVISETDGEPVFGASVFVVGTAGVGASTDMDGNFKINDVPSTATTLRVSYVGMTTQEVKILRNKPMRVVLVEDGVSLDEVMVVAYGTAKKSQFTGSAAVVKSEEIGKIQTSNAANALTGKMAGVQLTNASGQPGSSPTIRVRGITSINAGNAPLVVVDGVPYEGDMNSISTQDIESMTVLKDAASNALYGARGANGVIMITTKKGQSGSAHVSFDAKWGANTRAARDYDYIKNPAQYYEIYYQALKNYYIDGGKSEYEAHVAANNGLINGSTGLAYNVYSVPEGQYMIGENGKLNPNATLGNVVTYKGQDYYLTPDDYMDEAYNNSFRQEYNLNVSAGNDKSSFYASVNYLDNQGITANSDYERLAGRVKADYKVRNWLKVGANASYTHSETNSLGEDGSSGSSGNIFAYATQVAPIYPLYLRDGNGKIVYDERGMARYDYGDGENAGLERPFLPGGNPYSANLLDVNNSEGNAVNANAFAEITFLKNFKFLWTSSVDLTERRGTSTTNPYYGSYASSNGIVSKSHMRNLSTTHQQILTWEQSFGDHNFNVMAGHEYFRNKYYYLYASRSNQLDPSNNELASAITESGSNSYLDEYNTEGYLGRIMYDYDNKYYFQASYRRDGSSRFHPENRWGNFWSASAAWDISKEDFIDYDWIDILKLKASYGEQGNDQIGDFRYSDRYSIVNSVGHPGAVFAAKGNKDITWETQGNFNAGIDFELFRGRLSGTVDYFYRKTSDQLFFFPVAPSMGYTGYYANIGDMRNQGVEIDLKGTPIKTKDLEWNINLNLTSYKNKITSLPEERKTMEVDGYHGFSSGSYFYGEGLPIYTLRMKDYAGVNENGESTWWRNPRQQVDEKGNKLWVTTTDETGKTVNKLDEKGNKIPLMEDGKQKTTNYSDADYYLCGTTLPAAYGGFGTSLTWKGFDFSIDFVYQIGGQVLDSDYAGLMASPTSDSRGTNIHVDIYDSWTAANQTNIPRFQYNDQYSAASSTRFLTDASYLSLQNINFGYTLPKTLTKKMGVERFRVYLAADNIWYWSQRKGLDPRQSISGGATASYYSPIRTISGGVTLTF